MGVSFVIKNIFSIVSYLRHWLPCNPAFAILPLSPATFTRDREWMTTRSSSGSFSELAVPCNYLHFVNCRLLSQCRQCSHDNLDVCLAPGSLLVDRIKGVIVAMILEHECYDMNDRIAKLDGPMETMDCRGNILSPGFIDIQCELKHSCLSACTTILRYMAPAKISIFSFALMVATSCFFL